MGFYPAWYLKLLKRPQIYISTLWENHMTEKQTWGHNQLKANNWSVENFTWTQWVDT